MVVQVCPNTRNIPSFNVSSSMHRSMGFLTLSTFVLILCFSQSFSLWIWSIFQTILCVKETSPRGRGTQQSFIRKGCAQRPNPLPFYIWLLAEKETLSYTVPSIDKWYPFHMHSLKRWIPLNCRKCMCSKYEKITKLGNFLGFFTVINSSISPLGLFTDENDRNDRSPNPSSEMPILVVYLRPEKGTPFKEKLPV